jgi:hypothetical protein
VAAGGGGAETEEEERVSESVCRFCFTSGGELVAPCMCEQSASPRRPQMTPRPLN